jgi:hypothetical protein
MSCTFRLISAAAASAEVRLRYRLVEIEKNNQKGGREGQR